MFLIFLIFLAIFILNPYVIIGPVAYFFVFPFLFYSLLKFHKFFDKKTFFILLIMVFISLVGVLSSYIHGIDQYEHLKVSVSILFYIIIGSGLYFILRKNNLSFNDMIFMALLAILFNSIIVLAEVSYPGFRVFVESFLVEAGNRDWSEGFRYRGLASSGGASLSVLHAIGVVLLLYLLDEKYIGILKSAIILFTIIFSIFFIGRTGLIFIVLAFLLFFAFSKKNFYFLFFIILSALGTFLFYDYLVAYLIDMYGDGFYNYSLGFLVEGKEGVQEEGTLTTISGFLKVVPVTFPETIIGYGFYGGSDFEPWTDSGYSRMFLSVGYFFGISYYLCFFIILKKVFWLKKNLFLILIPLMLLAEVKEPLLFSGYSSRLLFVIIGFLIMENRFNLKYKLNN